MELAEELSKKLNLRIVARPSGTENLIRIMAESENEDANKRACALLRKRIAENIGIC